MIKKNLIIIFIIVILSAIISIILIYKDNLFGPFVDSPLPPENCGEYKFKVDQTINSKDSFINFLKNYQFEREVDRELSVKIENYLRAIDSDELRININEESSRAIFSNKKIYSLTIADKVNRYSYWTRIQISESGYISIRSCAGI
ncbi:MAG: hypothetical protein ABIJ91_05660 [Candidatus Kuenenbacteria bacterium]